MRQKATRTRREKGEGSIFFMEAKNLWCASINLGTDGNGKRKRKVIYAKTKEGLIQKKKDLEASIATGTLVTDTKTTVRQYLTSWLEDVYKATVRPSTYVRNKGLVINHIIPALGNVALSKLAPLQLQKLYGAKLNEGQSPRSIRNMHFVLHKALDQALRWGYVNRNVADMVDLPKPSKKEMQVLTLQQVETFLQTAKDDWYYPLYVTAVTTGLRQGELLGLQWEDLDLRKGTLTVKRALKELNGKLLVGEPKSKSARRTVTLPTKTVEVLKQHRKEQLQHGLMGTGYVFTDTQSGAVYPQNMMRRSFKPLLKKAGVPVIRFHDLRHTHATILLQQDVNPKLVQERLGHTTINLTLDTYSHVLPNMQRGVAEKLNALFV